jgi:hypothetical protein
LHSIKKPRRSLLDAAAWPADRPFSS